VGDTFQVSLHNQTVGNCLLHFTYFFFLVGSGAAPGLGRFAPY